MTGPARSIFILLLLLACGSAFVTTPELADGVITGKKFYFGAVMGLGTLLVAVLLLRRPLPVIALNGLDLLLLLGVGYGLFRLMTTPGAHYLDLDFVLLLALLLFYLLLRQAFGAVIASGRFLGGASPWLVIPLAAGLVQAGYGLLQAGGYADSFHGEFSVTGTFSNPAPYAAFLVSLLPLALGVALPGDGPRLPRLVRSVAGAYVLLGLAALACTHSRAGWVAAFVGGAVILNHRFALRHLLARYLDARRRRMLLGLGLGLVAVLLLVLYQLRPQSVHGRLLIWRISWDVVRDHPLAGAGYGQYGVAFDRAQAAYFSRNSHYGYESLRAGSGEYAFNEFIRLTAEYGLVGLALCGGVLWVALRGLVAAGAARYFHHPGIGVAAGASVAGLAVFALFSYPFSVLPAQANAAFCLALLSANLRLRAYAWAMPRVPAAGVALLALLGVLVVGKAKYREYHAYQRWERARVHVMLEQYDQSKPIFAEAYPVLAGNGKFLLEYGQALVLLREYPAGIRLLEKASRQVSDTYLFTDLGDAYRHEKNYPKAVACYRYAANMIPHLFYPKYLLFKVYREQNQVPQAVTVAQTIVTMPVKVPSGMVEQIRREAQTYLVRFAYQKEPYGPAFHLAKR